MQKLGTFVYFINEFNKFFLQNMQKIISYSLFSHIIYALLYEAECSYGNNFLSVHKSEAYKNSCKENELKDIFLFKEYLRC